MIVTKTIWSTTLELHKVKNLTYTPPVNTSLNEKFEIYGGDNKLCDNPSLKYLAIGNGNRKDINYDTLYNTFGSHLPYHGSLFNHIPFVVRTIDNDLSDVEKEKYKFRKIVTIGNTKYITYYLMKLDIDLNIPIIRTIEVDDINRPKLDDFVADTDVLNPVTKVDPFVLDDFNTKYIYVNDQLNIYLDTDTLANIRNGIELLGLGDKVINELALCSGIETNEEPDKVQVSYFIDMNFQTTVDLNSGGEFFKEIELGGMEAMYGG